MSDCWALGHLGITATYGLLSVVSLPSYFVFRIGTDGPHPFPWIRVKISLALGAALFPDPQWAALNRQWHDLYPTTELSAEKRALIGRLEAVLPAFARLVLDHRSPALRGQRVADIFPAARRQPARPRRRRRAGRSRRRCPGHPRSRSRRPRPATRRHRRS